MKNYTVEVKETLSRLVEVEAKSKEHAIELVEKMYSDCEIVLYPEDFISVKIKIYEDK